jgi:nucleotide-binding universal stress UspA family protein
MSQTRIAYMPLATYPEAVADNAIQAAVAFTGALGCALHVSAFTVDIPPISSPLGGILLDVPGLVRAAETKSRAEGQRLHELVSSAAGPGLKVLSLSQEVVLGTAQDVAAAEARYYDLAVLPWSAEMMSAQEMTKALVFGSGRPTIIVPPSYRAAELRHIAIAWDASRVAARALGDALALLADGARVSVLTVRDEKPLSGPGIAEALTAALEKRGITAKPIDIALGGRSISQALQDAAIADGAQLLAMGGFGHSRIRDFVLGGATKGILGQLRLPTLLAH